eukprot:TRINITY_DN75579_c0_g1_i1.p1 TRINITY_DN75579_c0_g1~~TRINITY_DN75579_c0_g1_i1.p1  ORF type:complete len:157 (+),score=44.95 TRINITY_DN75579_c0_g1_i1:88-558(+)
MDTTWTTTSDEETGAGIVQESTQQRRRKTTVAALLTSLVLACAVLILVAAAPSSPTLTGNPKATMQANLFDDLTSAALNKTAQAAALNNAQSAMTAMINQANSEIKKAGQAASVKRSELEQSLSTAMNSMGRANITEQVEKVQSMLASQSATASIN